MQSNVLSRASATADAVVQVEVLSSVERQVLGRVGVAILETLTSLARLKHERADEVTLFLPGWCLALAVGVSQRRVEQVLDPRMASGQLLARWCGRRAWITTNRGLAHTAGLVWNVRVSKPLPEGQRVFVRGRDMKHPWRDLGADVQARLTSWFTQNSGDFAVTSSEEKRGQGWTICKRMALKHDLSLSLNPNSEMPYSTGVSGLVWALEVGEGRDERDAVTEFADGLVRLFGDTGSRRWWCRVGWAVVKALRAGRDLRGGLAGVLERARAAVVEGVAINGAALATSELGREAWPALWTATT